LLATTCLAGAAWACVLAPESALAASADAQQPVPPAQPLPTLSLGPSAAAQDAAGITQAVSAALALTVRHVQTPPGARLEVEPGSLDPRLKLAPCPQVEPYLPAQSRLWGRTRIGLRCVNGPVRWNVYLPVTVKVWARALVAAHPLAAGATIHMGDLAQAEVDLASSPSPAHTDPLPLMGRVVAQSLAPGAAIRDDCLRQRIWFSAGDEVTVIARGPGYAISGSATALSNGVEGQSVRLRTESGRIITATPSGQRQVEMAL
jgi:flagella basal body P-ring formation protein FlgA